MQKPVPCCSQACGAVSCRLRQGNAHLRELDVALRRSTVCIARHGSASGPGVAIAPPAAGLRSAESCVCAGYPVCGCAGNQPALRDIQTAADSLAADTGRTQKRSVQSLPLLLLPPPQPMQRRKSTVLTTAQAHLSTNRIGESSEVVAGYREAHQGVNHPFFDYVFFNQESRRFCSASSLFRNVTTSETLQSSQP